MRRTCVALVLLLVLSPSVASASAQVTISASPNPAAVGQRVTHTITARGGGYLNVWVSAKGFAQPKTGTLPSGTWTRECCPPQTAGTAAWHFRSTGPVAAGSYRFGADAALRGSFLSTAQIGSATGSVWVRIV